MGHPVVVVVVVAAAAAAVVAVAVHSFFFIRTLKKWPSLNVLKCFNISFYLPQNTEKSIQNAQQYLFSKRRHKFSINII